MKRGLIFVLTLALVYQTVTLSIAQTVRAPLPFKVAARMADRAEPLTPSQARMNGYLGRRVANNAKNRLLNVDLTPLLAGFQKRPGSHPWIGEHIGKWLHAATLAWAYTGDPKLRAKLDYAARALIQTQEPDGYLGTYLPEKRFGLFPGSDWDVWSHKYDLIGLLTYYQYTGSPEALTACRKVGNLLLRTFGPGGKSILSAGTHVGMAATSVLEPIVLLYRFTGDARYLQFAKQIVNAWDEPNGPRVLTTLTTLKSVNRTGNGKAYEMLSNLVGLCELARATGDRRYLVPALNAWKDVVKNQLYLTGTASYHEHFHNEHDLPNAPAFNVGETCVTVTWIQLTTQLLRLTGEARYGSELERSYLNHLAAAQRPDGAEWCYYTALEGTKPYGPGINCCVSSGPRGMAMAPLQVYYKIREGRGESLAVNLFEPSQATLSLNGKTVTVTQTTGFPLRGGSELTFQMTQSATFGLKVRAPEWAQPMTVQSGAQRVTKAQNGWISLPPRAWKRGERVTIAFRIGARLVDGNYGNRGSAALMWGPMALAYDAAKNPGLPPPAMLALRREREAAQYRQVSRPETPIAVMAPVDTGPKTPVHSGVFVPFAEAGAHGSRYRVWLGAPGTVRPVTFSLLYEGRESRSARGNVEGSITDGETGTFVVTYDGKPHREDWFAVATGKPVTLRRIVYAHGRAFHDGGWFDASAGKPRIEAKRTPDGPWELLGLLEDYPETTATDSRGLRDGQSFTLSLNAPVTLVALRILGTPAHGDRPEQSFASCAELQAFAK